jgi:hypothetical protein
MDLDGLGQSNQQSGVIFKGIPSLTLRKKYILVALTKSLWVL